MPENSKLIDPSSNTVTLHLPTWKDGGCRMSHFVVEYKKKYLLSNRVNLRSYSIMFFSSRDHVDWNQVSNNVKPGSNFVVLDLDAASWYIVRITAHNSAGFTVAEYEFATLTVTGGKTILFRFCLFGNSKCVFFFRSFGFYIFISICF